MLKIENLNKSFGDNHVLKDVNLDINKGEIVMITGESGVGKTTLIRCLCGLENMMLVRSYSWKMERKPE